VSCEHIQVAGTPVAGSMQSQQTGAPARGRAQDAAASGAVAVASPHREPDQEGRSKEREAAGDAISAPRPPPRPVRLPPAPWGMTPRWHPAAEPAELRARHPRSKSWSMVTARPRKAVRMGKDQEPPPLLSETHAQPDPDARGGRSPRRREARVMVIVIPSCQCTEGVLIMARSLH